MKTEKGLEVYLGSDKVGILAIITGDLGVVGQRILFDLLREKGLSISPFSLPLKRGVFVPSKLYFNGLFGVFADSLPDAWGSYF